MSAESADVLVKAKPTWIASGHTGQINIGHFRTELGAISRAGQDGDQALFVMAVPSVWRSQKVGGEPFALETLMTAVFIHETTHSVQTRTYMRRFGEIAGKLNLPEDWSTNSLQERLGNNKEFNDSVIRESDLLFTAASVADPIAARQAAGEALRLMKARREKWFTGKDSGLGEIEDIFLTMEGSAQWAAYQWLVDPRGGQASENIAYKGFLRRTQLWPYLEGAALVFALDRLDGPSWRTEAFDVGRRNATEMLESALKTSRVNRKPTLPTDK